MKYMIIFALFLIVVNMTQVQDMRYRTPTKHQVYNTWLDSYVISFTCDGVIAYRYANASGWTYVPRFPDYKWCTKTQTRGA
jgi:hypothetical protein